MEHQNVHPVRTTADTQVEETSIDGNYGKLGNVDSTNTVAATANSVFDRVIF